MANIQIQSVWSPCWCYNLKQGCVAVGIYTVVFSLVSIVYTIWVMMGGQSSDLFSPFFETDIRYSSKQAGAGVIVFCIIFIVFSALLILGVMTNNRVAMFPWMFIMTFFILFSLAFAIWLVARYYIDVRSVLCAIFILVFTAFNSYCLLCVYSQTCVLKSYRTRMLMKLQTY